MTIEDAKFDEHDAAEDMHSDAEAEDLSIKEQILRLIAALKESAVQELGYVKARTSYSVNMVVKGGIFFFIAFIFVLVAFILLGIGLLLALKSIIGIIWAIILSMVIFLSLSLIMVWIGKSYFNKLSFPDIDDAQLIANDSDDKNE